MVLFCCDVGESGFELKAGYEPTEVFYRKCQFLSGNEVIVQKYKCFIHSKKKIHHTHAPCTYPLGQNQISTAFLCPKIVYIMEGQSSYIKRVLWCNQKNTSKHKRQKYLIPGYIPISQS